MAVHAGSSGGPKPFDLAQPAVQLVPTRENAAHHLLSGAWGLHVTYDRTSCIGDRGDDRELRQRYPLVTRGESLSVKPTQTESGASDRVEALHVVHFRTSFLL
jgi:hypothetical protein